MFPSVPTVRKSIESYLSFGGDQQIEEIRRLARPLEGSRVLHLSLSTFGAETMELLSALVPLMNSLGLQAEWQVIPGSEEFDAVSRTMYTALGGLYGEWTAKMQMTWAKYSAQIGRSFDQDYDFVVIHDPQPLGLRSKLAANRSRPSGNWIWHCHMDMSDAQPEVWYLLRLYLQDYDAAVFSARAYVKEDIDVGLQAVINPGIDPLGPKNMPLSPQTVAGLMAQQGLDPDHPMICYVERNDIWSDPLGVVEAFRLARRERPDLQLAVVAIARSNGSEERGHHERLASLTRGEPGVTFLTTLNDIGFMEVNALQRSALACVQWTARKGFDMTLLEAAWKGRPIVARRSGGVRLHVRDSVSGYLVDSPEEFATRLLHLLQRRETAVELGQEAKRHVQESFLITESLREYLRLFARLRASREVSERLNDLGSDHQGVQMSAG